MARAARQARGEPLVGRRSPGKVDGVQRWNYWPFCWTCRRRGVDATLRILRSIYARAVGRLGSDDEMEYGNDFQPMDEQIVSTCTVLFKQKLHSR